VLADLVELGSLSRHTHTHTTSRTRTG
jgi:hypothetical protein